jgi:methyltransferase (TIGR00027 family)
MSPLYTNLPLTLAGLCISPLIAIIYFIRRAYFGSQPQRMKANRPSYTAEMVCIWRSMATQLNLLQDHFGWEFVDWDAKFFIWLSYSMVKILGTDIGRGTAMMTMRTIAFDQAVMECSPKQFVVLGAGYDARPYRLPLLTNNETKVFEVDMLATQRAKKNVLHQVKLNKPKLFVRDPSTVEFVDVDFATESFMDKLKGKGFNTQESSTIFSLEGVATYLTYDELVNTLRNVSSNCAPGTRLIFNCRRQSTRWVEALFYHILKFIGEPTKFQVMPNDNLHELFGRSATGFEVEKIQEFEELVPKLVPSYKGAHLSYGVIVTVRV